MTERRPSHRRTEQYLTGKDFIESVPWRHDILDHRRREILQIIEQYSKKKIREVPSDTFVIAITGQSGLGKSAFAHQFAHFIGRPGNVVDLDTYILPRELRLESGKTAWEDDANDLQQAKADVEELLRKRVKYFPRYSHESGNTGELPGYVGEMPTSAVLYKFTRKEIKEKAGYWIRLVSRDYLILEGVTPFSECLAPFSQVKIFISTEEGLQLNLLHRTQTLERGYSGEKSFQTAVQKIDGFKMKAPGYEEMADIVIVCDQDYNYKIHRLKGIAGEKNDPLSHRYSPEERSFQRFV